MSFMKPQAVYVDMLHVETTAGTEMVLAHYAPNNPTPADLSDFCEGEPFEDGEVEHAIGWYARYSAHGYMDCTSWTGPYDTEIQALDALAWMYEESEEWDE